VYSVNRAELHPQDAPVVTATLKLPSTFFTVLISQLKLNDVTIYKALDKLKKLATPHQVLSVMEDNLTSFLCAETRNIYTHITENEQFMDTMTRHATHHQNILGWDNFLRGYTSKYWTDRYKKQTAQVQSIMDSKTHQQVNIYQKMCQRI
jgi:hypothetical protein